MNLKAIITEIDKQMIASLNAGALMPLKAFGLAEFYYDKDKKYPGIVNGGEVTNCLLDDGFNVSWYHRSEYSEYTTIEENYGDKMDKVEETTPVVLVIYANRIKTQQSLQTIKDIFASVIPSVLDKATCEVLSIFDCTIELRNAEMNTTLVFREECTIPDVRVGIEHGLISVRYEIKSTYRRGCEVICEC